MASELAEEAARLQQAPDVSGQMAELDQMMSVDNNNNYWVGRQPTQSPFADFRGIDTPPPQTGRTLTDAKAKIRAFLIVMPSVWIFVRKLHLRR